MSDIIAQRDQAGALPVREDPRWRRLHAIILEKSLKRGDFILSSGVASKYLFQLRQTTMLPEGAALIGEFIVEYMMRNGIKSVGGLELGAVPMVAAIAAVSHYKNYPVDAFFVRKQAKGHGARERLDGHVSVDGDVLFIDDVATSGQSIVKAIEGAREEFPGITAKHAFVVIDRQEGATQNLAGKGIELVSLFKTSDFPV